MLVKHSNSPDNYQLKCMVPKFFAMKYPVHKEKILTIVKCSNCDEIFSDKSKLEQHIVRAHPSLKCSICDSTVSGKSYLKQHMLQGI